MMLMNCFDYGSGVFSVEVGVWRWLLQRYERVLWVHA
jgi:hypothetical protein